MPKRTDADVIAWINSVLDDEYAWQFALSGQTHQYLANLSPEEVVLVVDRIIDILNSNPEYWQFCNCTMLIEEGIGQKASKAALSLKEYLGHQHDSFRDQASKALRAIEIGVDG